MSTNPNMYAAFSWIHGALFILFYCSLYSALNPALVASNGDGLPDESAGAYVGQTGAIPLIFDDPVEGPVTERTFDGFTSFAIVNRKTGAVLDIEDRVIFRKGNDDGNVIAASFDNTVFQLWDVVPAGTSFRFANNGSSRGLYRQTSAPGGNVVQRHSSSVAENRDIWHVKGVPGVTDVFTIVAGDSALAVVNGNVELKAANPSGGDHSQQWTLHPVRTLRPDTPNFEMIGWATKNGGTTGGKDAPGFLFRAGEEEAFAERLADPAPAIILVDGVLDMKRDHGNDLWWGQENPANPGQYLVGSDKTILGVDANAHIKNAELRLHEVNNVIIRNLKLSFPNPRMVEDPENPGQLIPQERDAIALSGRTTNVWIDHNELLDTTDGLVDITRGSDFVTVSWNRFSDTNHSKVSLIGANDEDAGDYRITYNNNWFRGHGRQPLARFGKVHLLNNFYDGCDVGVEIHKEARIVSEGDFFARNVRTTYQGTGGAYKPRETIYKGGNRREYDKEVGWDPLDEYPGYPVAHAINVPDLVRENAGVGVLSLKPKIAHFAATPVRLADPPKAYVDLEWKSAFGAVEYEIERTAVHPNPGKAEIERVLSNGDPVASFRDEIRLPGGTKYIYRVRGINADGQKGPWSNKIHVRTQTA